MLTSFLAITTFFLILSSPSHHSTTFSHSCDILPLIGHSFIYIKMHATKIFSLLAVLPAAMACLGYTGGVPKATGNVSYKSAYVVKKGQPFDGQWKRYDRGTKCTGQKEGGKHHSSTMAALFLN